MVTVTFPGRDPLNGSDVACESFLRVGGGGNDYLNYLEGYIGISEICEGKAQGKAVNHMSECVSHSPNDLGIYPCEMLSQISNSSQHK